MTCDWSAGRGRYAATTANPALEDVVNAAFTIGIERPIAVARGGGADAWLAVALRLDERLAEVAGRPGEAALTSLRLFWWEEAVAALADGPRPVDPMLLALAPLVRDRPGRIGLVARCVTAWDERDGAEVEPVAFARARLLCDQGATVPAVTGMAGWAAARMGAADQAQAWLSQGLAAPWPGLVGQRLLARAALHRLRGRGERVLALRLVGWSLSGG